MNAKLPLLILAGVALAPTIAAAQQPQQQADSLRRELRLLQARVDSLSAVLAELTRQRAETTQVADELAAIRAAAQAAAAEAQAGTDTSGTQESRTRNLSALNPEISVTGDVVGNFTAPAGQDRNLRAVPREFEFSFVSALDPYTRTKIFVTREEEIEIAGFPEEQGAPATNGSGFEVEEGYMYWVGLPGGLGFKIGKFRQDIGLYNRWHTHALLEVERPLAAATFLGEDGLIQTGAAVTLPSFTIGPTTQTVIAEATVGNNAALFADGNRMSYLGRFQNFWDLGASTYLQLGTTGVYGRNDDADLRSRALVFDFAFRWLPSGQSLYRDVQLKGEWYYVDRDEAGIDQKGSGGYAQVSFRADRRWILGVRADYVNGFGDDPRLLQLVPTITWWQSEWVRLRLQYNFLRPEGGTGNHTVLLQAVWAMGPHKHESY